MKRRKTVFIIALVIALFALAGCQHPAEPYSDPHDIDMIKFGIFLADAWGD